MNVSEGVQVHAQYSQCIAMSHQEKRDLRAGIILRYRERGLEAILFDRINVVNVVVSSLPSLVHSNKYNTTLPALPLFPTLYVYLL